MRLQVNGFRVLWLAGALILLTGINCFSDSFDAPTEATYYSENRSYYLKVIPVGDWLEKGYYIKGVFGRTDKNILWEHKIDFPTDVHISNNGKYIVSIGNCAGAGIRFYDYDGKLIKFVDSGYFPATYSVMFRHWYQRPGFTLDKDNKPHPVGRRGGEILPDNETFVLYLVNGGVLKFALSTGKLKSIGMDLSWAFSSEGLSYYLNTLPGVVTVLLLFINMVFAVIALIVYLITSRLGRRKTNYGFKTTKYLFVLSAAIIAAMWFIVNYKWLLLF